MSDPHFERILREAEAQFDWRVNVFLGLISAVAVAVAAVCAWR